jgi:hypothetical protein
MASSRSNSALLRAGTTQRKGTSGGGVPTFCSSSKAITTSTGDQNSFSATRPTAP